MKQLFLENDGVLTNATVREEFSKLKGGNVSDDSWRNCSLVLRQQHSLILEKPKLVWSHSSWLEELDSEIFADLNAMFKEDEFESFFFLSLKTMFSFLIFAHFYFC